MDMQTILREAGIAGAGGAGFPCYAKQAPGRADTLVINAAECEPLLYTDFTLLRERLAEVVAGGEALAQAEGIGRVILATERKKAGALGLSDGDELGPKTVFRTLPDAYPMGDEISLIWQTTGRLVSPGQLPISRGVIVQNTETVLQILGALQNGTPVTRKWLTVAGDVRTPAVLCVPVGTPVRELFAYLGIEVPQEHIVLDGGPAMGRPVDWESAVVKKTTKGITLLPPATESARKARRTSRGNRGVAVTACCQCTRCTDLCPRHLLGYPLEPHRMVRAAAAGNIDPVLVQTATLCCGCGICETVACSQGISPKMVIADFKAQLRREKMAFSSPQGAVYTPSAQRDYRMVPSARMADLLGVSRFDRKPTRMPDGYLPSRVEIPLSGHIGLPSVPVVSPGDRVREGQVIAQAAEGLSLPQHASVSGRVLLVLPDKIIIEREA